MDLILVTSSMTENFSFENMQRGLPYCGPTKVQASVATERIHKKSNFNTFFDHSKGNGRYLIKKFCTGFVK